MEGKDTRDTDGVPEYVRSASEHEGYGERRPVSRTSIGMIGQVWVTPGVQNEIWIPIGRELHMAATWQHVGAMGSAHGVDALLSLSFSEKRRR